MTETQHRFLAAIADRVPAAAVVEVRLFPSIRQGPIESGVAVVAADAAALAAALAPVAMAVLAEAGDAAPGADRGTPPIEPSPGPASVVATVPAADASDRASHGTAETAHDAGESASAAPDAGPARLSILTARYRLAIKGPDRGRWEFDVVHDADAPLETVEQVVRGVARRVGEDGEPEMLSGPEFSRAVSEQWWSTPT
jgi:hypothetical protein